MRGTGAARQFFARPLVHALILGSMGFFVLIGIAIGITGQGEARTTGWGIAFLLLVLTTALCLPLLWYQRIRLCGEGITLRAIGCTLLLAVALREKGV